MMSHSLSTVDLSGVSTWANLFNKNFPRDFKALKMSHNILFIDTEIVKM